MDDLLVKIGARRKFDIHQVHITLVRIYLPLGTRRGGRNLLYTPLRQVLHSATLLALASSTNEVHI